jgi:predicted transcriptional regulator
MKSIYLEFLSLAHDLENGSKEISKLDATERYLLQTVVLCDHEGKALKITDAMSLRNIASPATIHRKLKRLINLGLVRQDYEGSDRRTKYLIPTNVTLTYIESVGKAMADTLKGN